MRTYTSTLTWPLSGFASSVLGVKNVNAFAVHWPVVTSGATYLQGSPDTTSANFTRLQHLPPSSGDQQVFTLGGSLTTLHRDVGAAYVRFVSSAAQAVALSVVWVSKA